MRFVPALECDRVLLTVGIGNTNTAFGLWEGEQIIHSFRLRSDRERPIDEWVALLTPLLNAATAGLPIICCSVVPALTERVLGALSRFPGVSDPIIVHAGVPLGLTIHYDRPETLGSDRYIGSFAAWECYLKPRAEDTHTLIIDCGTATTFSLVSREGDFLGGSILPGIGTAMEALLARTAQLPRFDPQDAPLIAQNTIDALRSGMVHGSAAQIGGMIERYRAALGETARVLTIGTGGALPVITGRVELDLTDPELVLRGLFTASRKLSDDTRPACG